MTVELDYLGIHRDECVGRARSSTRMCRRTARRDEKDGAAGVGGRTYWRQFSSWSVLRRSTVVAEALERDQFMLELGSSIHPSCGPVLGKDDTGGDKTQAPLANGLERVNFRMLRQLYAETGKCYMQLNL